MRTYEKICVTTFFYNQVFVALVVQDSTAIYANGVWNRILLPSCVLPRVLNEVVEVVLSKWLASHLHVILQNQPLNKSFTI